MECSCSDRSLRADSWDLSIYVHLTPEASLRRGVARDSLLMEEAQRLRSSMSCASLGLDPSGDPARPAVTVWPWCGAAPRRARAARGALGRAVPAQGEACSLR